MNARLLCGHVIERLRTLPSESVHCVVTSPPYWGLRDYGIEPQWWGGDPGCDHEPEIESVEREMRRGLGLKDSPAATRGGAKKCAETPAQAFQHGFCVLCGAWLGCFGLEPSPELYIEHALAIFREVRRVLRKDGTLWLNMGDCYAGSWGAQSRGNTASESSQRLEGSTMGRARQILAHPLGETGCGSVKRTPGLKPKDLVGLPWMLAFALRADGWYLRQDIIWAKPNPMPESVRDRCTKAHEYLFLLSKSPRYYYDQRAVAEPVAGDPAAPRNRWDTKDRLIPGQKPQKRTSRAIPGNRTHSVGALYAAGDQHHRTKGGLLAYAERARAAAKGKWSATSERQAARRMAENTASARIRGAHHDFPLGGQRNRRSVWLIATEPFPEPHFATFPTALVEPCILAGCPPGGLVLDPFSGSGTTGVVALRLGRDYLGIDLNPGYTAMAERRLSAVQPLLHTVEVDEKGTPCPITQP